MSKEKMHKIVLLPGDGIGQEVTSAAHIVIAAAGTVEKHGKVMPDDTLEVIKRDKVALKGPITTPIGGGFQSVNVQLRRNLDLSANVRPVRWAPGVSFQHSPGTKNPFCTYFGYE